jgi:alkanesulfonate monooxygenase SsuD/methylene tetrahydromethanopterin reductase-like flavin-dependent oxidoreductase (luciferase family)
MIPFRIVNAGAGLSYPDCMQLDLFYELAVPDFAMRNEAQVFVEKTLNLATLETLGMVVAGDPAHCRQQLETYRDAGVDHLLCAISTGGIPSEAAQASMRILADHVIPHFAN